MFNLLDPVPPDSDGAAGTLRERFDTLLTRPECRIERIVSHGHVTAAEAWYDQDWDEWIALIEGEALLELADLEQPLRLRRGDCLLIEAHRRHRVLWTSPASATIWLAIHFAKQ